MSRNEEFSRRFDHGPETPWASGHSFGTTYSVTAPASDQMYFAPGARVKVDRPTTWYDHDDQSAVEPVDSHGDLARFQFGEGPGNQGALFGVRHTHPYVSWMESHKDYGAYIPGLLSVAALEAKARYRESLRSDKSLSESSSPIVHRLAQAGAVTAPAQESRNRMRVNPDVEIPTRRYEPDVREVPASTVNLGRQFLRTALRRPKQAVSRSVSAVGDKKSTQQEMFG